VDAKTFVERLAADQPWMPQDVVQEVAQAIECHTAGAVSPQDQNLQLFIAEIARRLRETHR
jgi:HD superfamily phosphohydrolase YqeK